MKKIISVLLMLSCLSTSLILSGCGKSENNSSSEKKENSAEASASHEMSDVSAAELEVSIDAKKPALTETQLNSLNEKIASHQGIPEFEAEATNINASEIAKDLRISLIPENSTNSYYKLLSGTFEEAAKRAGFKDIVIAKTDGSDSRINDGLADAVKQKSDVIVMAGDINKSTVSSYIENAQANGIEVLSGGCCGMGEDDHFVDYTIPINYQLIGELMADWGIVKTTGKLNAIAVNCTDSPLSDTISKGFKQEFEKYVSADSGSCVTINITSLEADNGLSNKIKQALEKDSRINYIFVFDDSSVNAAISAAVQAGSSAKIVATGGSDELMKQAESGSVEMLVAQSYEWTAYALVDYALRVKGNETLPKEAYVPVRVLTKETIKKAIEAYDNTFDGFYEICFGGNFIRGYNGLWGK